MKGSDVKHGYENEHIKKHETSVLIVRNCMEKDNSPQAVVKDSVLMKVRLEPLHEKTNNLSFRPGLTQTDLYR